jgi:hypothetical protein
VLVPTPIVAEQKQNNIKRAKKQEHWRIKLFPTDRWNQASIPIK